MWKVLFISLVVIIGLAFLLQQIDNHWEESVFIPSRTAREVIDFLLTERGRKLSPIVTRVDIHLTPEGEYDFHDITESLPVFGFTIINTVHARTRMTEVNGSPGLETVFRGYGPGDYAFSAVQRWAFEERSDGVLVKDLLDVRVIRCLVGFSRDLVLDAHRTLLKKLKNAMQEKNAEETPK